MLVVAPAGAFSTLTFLVGAVTSILSGYLGMTIAVYANARTALQARKVVADVERGAESCLLHIRISGRNAARRRSPFTGVPLCSK